MITKNTKNLVEYIAADESMVSIFRCCMVRGLITQKMAEKITGLSTKVVRNVMDQLVKPPYPCAPALESAGSMQLAGRAGRPENFYILTKEGAAALESIEHCSGLHAPALSNSDELLHTFAEMQVYTTAVQAGYQTTVERVIPYGNKGRNIRPDLLLQKNSPGMIFEIEQEANAASLPRIISKLQGLLEFFQSSESRNVSKQIRILFHVANEHAATVSIWQKALNQVIINNSGETLPYELHAKVLSDFINAPAWHIGAFEPIQPMEQEIPRPQPSAPSLAPAMIIPFVSNSGEMLKKVETWAEEVSLETQNPQRMEEFRVNACHFFTLMKMIYGASFYRDSPTELYGIRAEESLELLKRYLYDPKNQGLLTMLKTELGKLEELQGRVTTFRDGLTKTYWKFMVYHGFDRDGAIKLTVEAPEFGGSSEYHVWIRIQNIDTIMGRNYYSSRGMGQMNSEEKALAWVLGTIYLHAEEFGLVEPKKK